MSDWGIGGEDAELRSVMREYVQPISDNPPRFLECYGVWERGLDGSNMEQSYLNAIRDHFESFLQTSHYVLENYLVNYVFSKMFPFDGQEESTFDAYCRLMINYGFIKTLLAGTMQHLKDAFALDDAVRCISPM